jgi:hypothetical protein
MIDTRPGASRPGTSEPHAGGLDGDPAVKVLLEEYKALKTEQVSRIGIRDNLIYAMILAVAAVAGGTPLAGHAVPLLLPPVGIVLGWTYLANDRMITAIGRYLRDELGARLAAHTGEPVFGWEHEAAGDTRRRQRKLIQLGIDVGVFALPGLAALVAFWCTGRATPLLVAVSVVEVLAAMAFVAQLALYADLRGRSARTRS